MKLKGLRVGFAITGSFCTFDVALECLKNIKDYGAEVTAIISDTADKTDTRFMESGNLRKELEKLTGKQVITTITEAEPIGPQALLDLMVILPATGNTIAKLVNGITDTTVTMATKAHLRNERPLLIAVSTNDALGSNAKNIGLLMNTKNVYFVPFGQDDPEKKPKSLVFLKHKVISAMEAAAESRQLQPLIGIH